MGGGPAGVFCGGVFKVRESRRVGLFSPDSLAKFQAVLPVNETGQAYGAAYSRKRTGHESCLEPGPGRARCFARADPEVRPILRPNLEGRRRPIAKSGPSLGLILPRSQSRKAHRRQHDLGFWNHYPGQLTAANEACTTGGEDMPAIGSYPHGVARCWFRRGARPNHTSPRRPLPKRRLWGADGRISRSGLA
jgi:hypothetical protein